MTHVHAARVAVTGDPTANRRLVEALTAAGLEPVRCPAIEIQPPRDLVALLTAVHALDRHDWLIVASTRAVDVIQSVRGGAPLSARLRTAAVGEPTAQALRAAGADTVLVASRPGAAGLVDVLRNADRWPGRRVLVPRAEGGRTELVSALRSWGAAVTEVIAYRTVAQPRERIVEAWRSGAPEAAVIASPSAARALIESLGAAVLRSLRAVVAIGPTTAEPLEAAGVSVTSSEAADVVSAARCARRVLAGAAREART
jgi:uroporphyrinogen-III synthase